MEQTPPPKDYSAETALAQRVARIFGYDGLIIDVREGAGWQTIRSDKDVTLVVDPTMLQPQAIKDATGAALPADTKVPEEYSMYGIAHELGHVDDFLQPESDIEKQKKQSPADAFFWNVLDDGVINRRLRHIPLLNNLTDEIYQDMLFPGDDYSKLPKHVQFMYGWLLRNVTPKRELTFSDDVQQALDGLATTRIGRRSYDLYRTLAHPKTTYGKRQAIAEAHIHPIYQGFLKEDAQNKPKQSAQRQSGSGGQSGRGSSAGGQQQSGGATGGQSGQGGEPGSGMGPGGFEELYEAYADASHCGEQHDERHDAADKGSSNNSSPHQAIQEAAGAMQEQQADQAVQAGKLGATAMAGNQAGGGAGTIAAELMLSHGNALAYQQTVERYRAHIHEVARVLQQLTVPSVEFTSPRYRRQPDIDGLKLSPRDLYRVVVAKHSHEDPAVWRPIETITKREGYSFNGLDVHLLIDVSGSMAGAKAEAAAACGVIFMEGLASARRMVERYNPRAPKPDVRLEVILFGSSAKIVAPLGHEIDPRDKGVAFTTTRAATSGSTLVADALHHTKRIAAQHPERTQLVYIITDGEFGDDPQARSVLQQTSPNFFVHQYILLSPGTRPITKQHSYLTNPSELPAALNKQLKVVAARFL
ncbi:MAG TPA: vWA domain-containing protein [Candidatus Saccharimonadales bacterium]|nr:vWA domain-containing protein [Candidatus Saccharimonadales bacterium]